ncbi:MAG: helix-turn-helix domain-containing protein [Thermoanaerobacterales bacterium]|nr:ArsR family transcriptional regulator [Thermoanaerobacterales bacterium]
MDPSMVLRDPDAIAAVTHPLRAAILDAMREPTTAAAVARRLGEPRQKVAYHVRELEKAGLLRHVGQRQNGNFLEQVYEAVARTFVISPAATWGDAEARSAALADQVSLGELHRAGERLQRDSAVLLDRAAFDGEEVPSASVTTEIRFASDEARAAFLAEHLDALAVLVRKYGARSGTPYRIVLAAYPDPEADP